MWRPGWSESLSPSAEAPRVTAGAPGAAGGDVLLEVRNLVKHFSVSTGLFGGRQIGGTRPAHGVVL